MLKIIAADEPIHVERLIVTIYSPPGVGKTSLGFSSASPLLLDADGGAYRSGFRGDSVPAQTWADIAGITADDVKPYKTLVLDTAGRTLDLLAADIIANNPKLGRGGALTLQGYGELKSRFAAYLKLMRSFQMDIVLIAHSDEKQQGDETIERLDMQGGSKQEVYKCSDAMARLGIIDGKRVLTFSPTETTFGKDPAQLGRVPVPNLAEAPQFLAVIIQRIKDALNKLSAEQKNAAQVAKEWTEALNACKTPDNYTGLVGVTKDAGQKRLILNAATKAGLAWDKDTNAFAVVAV